MNLSKVNTQLPFFIKLNNNLICYVFDKIDIFNESYYIGFPKLKPTNEGEDLVLEDTKYVKGKSYEEWFYNSDEYIKNYIKKIDLYGEDLFCFPETEVVKKYFPNDLRGLDSYTEDLISKISLILDIDKKDIGVEGSKCIRSDNGNSDTDIFIYGFKNSKNLLSNFYKLKNENSFKLNGEEDFENIIKKRLGSGFGKTNESIFEQEIRRFNGNYLNKKFSIIPILYENDYNPVHRNRKLVKISDYENVVEITDDSFGSVSPTIYRCLDLNENSEIWVEIYHPHGVNQAKKGEKFKINGSLYLDVLSNEKVIILGFWLKNGFEFNLLN